MAEKYRFFDPVMDENGNYDREYNAQEFVEYFSALVTTGVMKGAGNQLTVTADNASMVTTLDTGIAFILGRYYENDAPLQHIHDTETVGKQRIDRIVIRMDNNAGSRYVKSFVKKGVASTSPVPPALTQTGTVHEISVSQVKIIGGQTFISAENVIDERGTDIVCPWAGSRILPNFDDVALQELQNKIENMFSLTDGSNAKDYTGDLNDLLETGFYATPYRTGANMPGGAGNSRWFIQVMNTSTSTEENVVYQTAYKYDNNGPEIYIRNRTMFGTWQPWKKLIAPPTNWIQATLKNGWTHSSTGIVYYLKDDFGRVHINGQLHRPHTPTGLTSFMRLPAECRPKTSTVGFAGYGGNAVQIDIHTDGNVYIHNSQVGYYAINIIFATE